MNFSESDFHHVAEAVIDGIYQALESQDPSGTLDLEPAEGMLTILPEGKARPWIVSRHSAAREIWLSSPVSGGLHFRGSQNGWFVPDGRELRALLAEELSAAAARRFTIPS